MNEMNHHQQHNKPYHPLNRFHFLSLNELPPPPKPVRVNNRGGYWGGKKFENFETLREIYKVEYAM